jgi:ATP-dependent Clp protease ATP-binding subunit ClpC
MFERFTDRARRVVVRAQEEARGLQHNYIGTEHLLLALLDERDGIAARALERFEMRPDPIREEVKAMVGMGSKAPKGHIPFTPRAKKILELALREALELHHNYIGTEHILLGVIREGEGVGAQILKAHAADLLPVRMAVLDMLQAAGAAVGSRRLRDWLRAGRRGEQLSEEPGEQQGDTATTPAAENTLGEAARLAGEQPIGSHHLMLAALTDINAAAARALSEAGIDLDRAREALRGIDVTGTSDELPQEAGRRQMVIRIDQDKITIEAADQLIITLGQAALGAVGDQADPAGTIRGSLPASTSLSDLWLALRDSLNHIRRSGTPPAVPPKEAGDKPTQTTSKPAETADKPDQPGSEVA